MQTDPTARHSLIGPFQRVCYLALLEHPRTHRSNLGELASCMTKVAARHAAHRPPGIADRPGRAGSSKPSSSTGGPVTSPPASSHRPPGHPVRVGVGSELDLSARTVQGWASCTAGVGAD
jgi:hypothetical protein